MTSLRFDDVGVRYGRDGDSREALRAFSADVRPGEWLCLIGPNGAGKSSLLRATAGVAAHSGSILVDGSPLASRSSRRRAQLVAYVPQAPVLPAGMTGLEYVLLGRNPFVTHFGRESSLDHTMVDNVIERLDLVELARRDVETLSGGERQRLVIARAVAQEAPILLLDEPTSALDIGHQQQALELVDRLRREHGLTVVSAMHDLTLAGIYSDRLMLLHEGATVAAGAAEDVLRPETLGEFYGVNVRVHREPDGTIVVVPHRSGGA
ncbi:MAG: ABC transporter ATP-binding protein [Actinomycetota bacterium]